MKTARQISFYFARLVLAVAFLVSGPILQASTSTRVCDQVHVPSQQSPSGWRTNQTPEQKIGFLSTAGIKTESEAFQFSTWILQQSPKEQDQWLQALGNAYRKVANKSDRRHLDLILMQLQNESEFFEYEITQKHHSPKRAYENFLLRQSILFNTKYSAQEVEIVITWIQKQLKALERVYPSTSPTIVLAGSFPNGKADLFESDIDLSVTDDRAMKWLQYWPAKLTEMLQQSGVKSHLEIKFSNRPTSFFGGLNPIVFEITSSEVQLKVFSSPRGHQSIERESPIFNSY